MALIADNAAPTAPGIQPAPAETPLRRPATTGQDNLVRVAPFEVFNVQCPAKWDPQTQRLAVTYDINDPNARVVSGRVVYLTPPASAANAEGGDGQPVVLHVLRLPPALRAHGRHALPPDLQWDGTLTRGPADRIGQKITADLAPVQVLVQIWNSDTMAPPGDRSAVAMESLREHESEDWTLVGIDAIAEARWDRTWVIPWDDPDEPEHGAAKLLIRVRNVLDGTPVRLQVNRIYDVADATGVSDQEYAATGKAPADQPGLEGAVVRGGRVLLPNGSPPEVRFNAYEQHWIEAGNNFYCYRVAFGERGSFQAASQRDYQKHERDCLHLRFTVFIHRPAGDLGYSKSSARELHRFLRNDTKYYRSYLMEGPAKDAADWVRHWRHRYVVVFAGHAACFCDHPDHPRKKKNPSSFVDMPHRGYPPDRNVCPDELELWGIVALAEDLEKYHEDWMWGCGHKERVTQWSGLGWRNRDEKLVIYHTLDDAGRKLVYSRQTRAPADKKDRNQPRPWLEAEGTPVDPDDAPRLLFYNGGCRTMLTTNFGECLTAAGTRFHTGWVYSVLDEVDGRYLPDFFKRWIKGTRADPAPTEYDADRIPDAFRQLAQRASAAEWHPRIMDATGVLNPAPDELERRLK